MKTINVACDDGYAETKVVLEDGTQIRVPSLVRPGKVLGTSNDEVHSYETTSQDGSDVTFTVTGTFDTSAMNTRHDGYPFSSENRIMIHHALRRAGLGGQKVNLATSLPVSDYFDGSSVNRSYLEMKSISLMGRVVSTSGEACAEIVQSRVFPEGVSAWVDYSLDSQGNFKINLKRTAVVIDIGGRTTDTVKVLKQLSIEKESSGTCNLGVLDIYDELASSIARNKEILSYFPRLKASSITRNTLDDVLKTGIYMDHGLNIDLVREVKEAKSNIATKIFRDVESKIGSGIDLEHMIFVGGGAAVLEDEIRSKFKFKMVDIVDDPEFANARGMLKALMLG